MCAINIISQMHLFMLNNEGKKVDILNEYFAGETLCRHQDSTQPPSEPVILHHSHIPITGLGPFWHAQSGPNWEPVLWGTYQRLI